MSLDTNKAPNPYNSILESNGNDAKRIQGCCDSQRKDRNSKFRVQMLAEDFEGLQPDQILSKRLYEPDYVDPRNCLVFWARPTLAVRNLVARCQQELQAVHPSQSHD